MPAPNTTHTSVTSVGPVAQGSEQSHLSSIALEKLNCSAGNLDWFGAIDRANCRLFGEEQAAILQEFGTREQTGQQRQRQRGQMSYLNHEEADCTKGDSQILLRIKPREKDLGAFSVRRVLPASAKRMVGPFVFFDQMGPAVFQPGQGIDVRPHPHIGIATITYLFEGEILHKDSLGVVQPITPGEINLMTAGSGITHAERPGSDFNEVSKLFGIQSWIALPDDQQEIDAAFDHYTESDLPSWTSDGASFRLIMGSLDAHASPVKTYSKTLYADISLAPGAETSLNIEETEAALYVAEGEVRVDQESVEAGVMVVLDTSRPVRISADQDSRLLLIGGEPVGERHLYWNFVSNSTDRINRAKSDWTADRFPKVPGDDEFIPLPD